MAFEIPAHVYARIAEDVSGQLELDVSAVDVEFILHGMTEDGFLLSPEDTKRWYSFDTYTRSAVVAAARDYGF